MSHYAKISDPKKVRIALLEAAKEPIVLLSQQKKMDEIRKQKHEKADEITSEFNDLINLIKKLERKLPEKELRIEAEKIRKLELANELKAERLAEKKKANASKKTVNKTTKKSKKEEKPLTEVDRLEYTLDKIEEKINSLK